MSISVYSTQLDAVSREMEQLSLRSNLSAQEDRRLTYLTSQAATYRSLLAAETAKHSETRSKAEQREEFRSYLKSCPQVSSFALEQRTYSPLTEPSGLVPASYFKTLLLGIAQYTDLMREDTVRLITADDARPMTVPALDLSQITATIVGQGQDNAPSSNPVAGSISLGTFTYRASPIAASIELEQDSFEGLSDIFTQAFSVGLARGIGADLINGNGTAAPLGLLNAAGDSGYTTTTSGVVGADDIRSIYFKLNRAYRVSPKCAWIMNESLYETIRGLADSQGRPLIRITDDSETLYGKRVILAPDMPTASGDKGVLFGDLSQYVVRVNRASTRVTRSFQAPGYAEAGQALYTAWLSVDARLNVVNSTKPVTSATLA